jgi:hypothetical protein
VIAEIVTFPCGTAEGLPVIRLDAEGTWSSSEADAALARVHAPGIWGVWLDGIADWADDDLSEWIAEQGHELIGLRKLGAEDWPASPVNTVLDISDALEHAQDISALAVYVTNNHHPAPQLRDIVAYLGGGLLPPPSNALDLLVDFMQPDSDSYLYAPAGYKLCDFVVRTLANASSTWALRTGERMDR